MPSTRLRSGAMTIRSVTSQPANGDETAVPAVGSRPLAQLASIILLLMTITVPCSAAEPGAFRFLKDIQRSETEREDILGATLDTDIYRATRDGLPDVRIFDAKNQESPYLLEKVTESRYEVLRETVPSNVVSLKEHDNTVEIVVQFESDTLPEGFVVHTPLVNFERRLRIFSRKDGEDWTPLADNILLFDYSRFMDVRNCEARIPKSRGRNLKIVIEAITDSHESPYLELTRRLKDGVEQERIEQNTLERRPLRIERLEFWRDVRREVGQQDKKSAYPIVNFRAEENPKEKLTYVYVWSNRQPLTELMLETSSRNFSRMASVEKPVRHGDKTAWAEIAQGQIRRIDFRGYRKESLTIGFAEHRETEYRVVIRNEDSPPLSITGVKTQGNMYRTVFLAAAKENYRLYYGSDVVEQPKYDAAAVLTPLRHGGEATPVALGPQTINPAVCNVVCKPSSSCSLFKNPLALGILATLLAAILGWALYRAAQRINQLPKDPE